MEQKGKGLRDRDNSVVIVEKRVCKGLKANGKNTIKIKSKKERETHVNAFIIFRNIW